MRSLWALLLLAPCWIGPGAASTEAAGAVEQVAAAIHVHSSYSNGDLSIEDLARMAEDKDLGLLVVTDSLLTRVTYGVWPLDRIGIPGLSSFSRPGILDRGVRGYLEEIDRARARHPDLVILAGAEVAPAWYWTGTPWSGLTLHGFDRHLIVLGLDAGDLGDLPVAGNESWSNTGMRWSRLLLPLVLTIGGVVILARGRNRRGRLAALALALAGAIVAWNNYPFGLVADPGSARHDPSPYQRLIDRVVDRDGLVYWSYPEAKYGAIRVGGASMVSEPHPEDLLATDGYDGFEGLYGDEITVTAAGSTWDRALMEHLEGKRARPPFVITGIDYHGPKQGGDGWDTIDGGSTILLMPERSASAAIEALRRGRGYATFQAFPQKWRLGAFSVTTADGARATHGESITGRSPVTIAWEMDWLDGAPDPDVSFRFDLIRNGEVIERFTSLLPIRGGVVQDLSPGRYCFRVMADAQRLNRLLTNPVFVTVE